MSASSFSEKKLVSFFQKIHDSRHPSVLFGIGDDAAVLQAKGKILATTDSLQEKIHFDWSYTTPFILGRKSIAVNLSDIAAMGGKPLWALMSLAIPATEKLSRIVAFQRGVKSIARQFGVQIVGGDTDHSRQGWKITLSLLGQVKHPVFRQGAKIGDAVWVTGFPGRSSLGLELLRRKMKKGAPFIKAHLDPLPRIREGMALSQQKLAHSMIDISDGLALDLERICEASSLGAEISTAKLPFARGYRLLCEKIHRNPLDLILSGGEDYELLFTAAPQSEKKILNLFARLKTPVHCIGKMTQGKGVKFFSEEKHPLKLRKKGYSHF